VEVFQGSFGGGFLTDLGTFKKVNMMDRFFLGGPMTLRGFQSRGIGNLSDNVVAGVTVIHQNINMIVMHLKCQAFIINKCICLYYRAIGFLLFIFM